MASKRFKEGDLVRRCLTSGTPVGGVCIIDDVEDAGLYVRHIPADMVGSFYVKKNEVVHMKCVTLKISNKDANYLEERKPYAFARKTVPSWSAALKERIFDAVVLVAPNKKKFILKNVTFWQMYEGGEVAMRWETYLFP